MKIILYNTIGAISLSLGILGAFLPLLPSTCFILLAAWVFAKSSPTFHAWLYFKSPFAESIQNWQQHQIIPTKVKWMAFFSTAVSYTITAFWISNLYVLGGLGMGMLALLAYLFSKPGELQIISNQAITYSQTSELHQPVM